MHNVCVCVKTSMKTKLSSNSCEVSVFVWKQVHDDISTNFWRQMSSDFNLSQLANGLLFHFTANQNSKNM